MFAELLVILLLVLVNGILAGAELAIARLDKMALRRLHDKGGAGARAIERLRNSPERFFATVQIGITVVGASAAAFGGATFAEDLAPILERLPLVGPHAEWLSITIVVTLISYLSLVLGELVPKSLAMRHSEKYARLIAPFVLRLSALARPLVWILTASSNLVLALFGDKTSFSESRTSAAELHDLVGEATESGSLPPVVGAITSRALELVTLSVRRVMIPRNRVIGIPMHATNEEIRDLVLEHGFSRFPTYREDLDHITGYVLVKDLLAVSWQKQLFLLSDLVRPPLIVSQVADAAAVLQEMREKRVHLAMVVDEHGGTAGIVTLEDLLEELVGEIASERSKEQTPLVVPCEDGSFQVRGDTPVRDLNRALSVELEESDSYSTVSGLCLALLGHIPKPGESLITKEGLRIGVQRANERGVQEVRVWLSADQRNVEA